MRALAACWPLVTMRLASRGVLLEPDHEVLVDVVSTKDRISVLPSLVLVWPSNWGSGSFTATIAVSPSRMSSR